MMKVLHITPHLGGGVGAVLLNWIINDKSKEHNIVTLDYANENALNVCKKNGIKILSECKNDRIIKLMSEFDIVLIHFWNHPLLYDFLIRNKLPKSRIAIWAHISGIKAPQVFNEKLTDLSDKFVFTTPISRNYFVGDIKKTACILSTSGVSRFQNVKKAPHEGCNACYIGTLDYAKMNKEYINVLSKTNVSDIFITGWGKDESDFSKTEDKKFKYTGMVDDISIVLKKSDIFAYLLNPNHYGTGEQVLQEAMSAGVVPVVLNNPCEQALVKHMQTGLIANNYEEYAQYINLLVQNSDLRKKLSKNAKKYAKENFSLTNMIKNWNSVFDELVKIPKTEKAWNYTKKTKTSYDIFIESLGKNSDIFENKSVSDIKQILKYPEWSSDSKGTPKQYYKFLGGEKLKEILQ